MVPLMVCSLFARPSMIHVVHASARVCGCARGDGVGEGGDGEGRGGWSPGGGPPRPLRVGDWRRARVSPP